MKITIIIITLLLSKLTYSQVIINGQIRDYFGNEALINVRIVNNDQGTLSDLDGEFSLTVAKNTEIHFSSPGHIDLVFMTPVHTDSLKCDFYMIPIEPYKPYITEVYIKRRLLPDKPVVVYYHKKMDKIWINTRKLDRNTPLNWRLQCMDSIGFDINSHGMKYKYRIVYDYSFVDYRKYSSSKNKDYYYCEINE